ncbi:MAG: DMT family transporter [Candidatus Caldatribacteriota bacterium]
MSQDTKGRLLVLCAAFLWSTSSLFIKKIPAHPLFITFARAAIAGLTLLPFIQLKRIRLNKYFFGYMIIYTITVSTFVIANKLTTAANVIALQYTAPLYLLIYTIFTKKEILGYHNTIPIIFVTIGISLFLMEPNQASTSLGNIIALSSGMAMAIGVVFLHLLSNQSAVEIVSLTNLGTALLILPFIPSTVSTISSLGIKYWFYLFYLGAIQIGLAYLLFTNGLKYITPLNASIITLTEAIFNPLWVFFFLGEKPSIYGLVGGIIILASVASDALLRRKIQKVKYLKIRID